MNEMARLIDALSKRLTAAQLRSACVELGLSRSGIKRELAYRLVNRDPLYCSELLDDDSVKRQSLGTNGKSKAMKAGITRDETHKQLVKYLDKNELKTACKKFGLSASGTKVTLAERLIAYSHIESAKLLGINLAPTPKRRIKSARKRSRELAIYEAVSEPSNRYVASSAISSLVSSFAREVNELIASGIRFDRAGNLTLGGAGGAAGISAVQGDWLIAGIVAVAGVVTRKGIEYWMRSKIARFRDKWVAVFDELDSRDRDAFVSLISARHPGILQALHATVLGSASTPLRLTD